MSGASNACAADRASRIARSVCNALALVCGLAGADAFAQQTATPNAAAQPSPATIFGDPASGVSRPTTVAAPAPFVAPFDLKGRWVAVITEDWRFRMVTPPKGDFTSIPLTAEGRRVAGLWDPEKDQANGDACKAYGVGNVMRMPLRLNISENGDGSWRIETDHGQQVRTLYFKEPKLPAVTARTWQGESVATWEENTLKVVTKNMRAGYLRRNGVPYSENAVVTETFIRHSEGAAGEWFTVSTVVEDPLYLREPFLTSSSFKRLTNEKDWKPGPCVSEWGPLKVINFRDPFKL